MTRHFCIAVLFASFSSASTSQPTSDPFKDYIFCVLQSAVDFSATTEPAETIAKAAETKCARMKDAAVNASVANLKKSGPPPHSASDAELRRLAEEYITQRTHDEAVLKVLEIRTKK